MKKSIELNFNNLLDRYYNKKNNTWHVIQCFYVQTYGGKPDDGFEEDYNESFIPDNLIYIGEKQDQYIPNWPKYIKSYKELIEHTREFLDEDDDKWFYIGGYLTNGSYLYHTRLQICENGVISTDCMDEVNLWVPKNKKDIFIPDTP